MSAVGRIVKATVDAKKPVTHRVIGESFIPTHRYHFACGVSMRASETKDVRTKDPTCKNCQRRGQRKWRFRKSN